MITQGSESHRSHKQRLSSTNAMEKIEESQGSDNESRRSKHIKINESKVSDSERSNT